MVKSTDQIFQISLRSLSFHLLVHLQMQELNKNKLVHWYMGISVHWYMGILVQWYMGTLVHWYMGTLVQWYMGTLVHWYMGISVHWYMGILVHWYMGHLWVCMDLVINWNNSTGS